MSKVKLKGRTHIDGLRFAKEVDHWRCVEHPELVMLCGERYQLDDASLMTGFSRSRPTGLLTCCSATRLYLVRFDHVNA